MKEIKVAGNAESDPNARNEDGRTPLHDAALLGQTGAIAALIAKGADHNAQDETGNTPLHIAAHHGQTEAIAALIAKGADHNARDERGRRNSSRNGCGVFANRAKGAAEAGAVARPWSGRIVDGVCCCVWCLEQISVVLGKQQI